LGYSYAQELGVQKDLNPDSHQFRWWSNAAERGNAVVRTNLDILCRDNSGGCETGVVVVKLRADIYQH
jgi:hypothetical protein